jgi:hypothetical protein
MMANNDRNSLPGSIDAGLEVAATAATTAGGLLIAGPLGAVGGAAAAPALTAGLREVISRVLSRRERARVHTAANYAVSALREQLDADEQIRSDSFLKLMTAADLRQKRSLRGCS